MAETVAGGQYLATDGKTLVNANGEAIEVAPGVEATASDNGGGNQLPSVKKLAEFIADLSAEEVRALQEKDARATAAAIYEARLAELAGE